jgi:uncharacterized protein (TIGR00106 family)
MSVLIDFSIFPVGKGESVSSYVAQAVEIIRASGLVHKLGPMGTTIEGDWNEVMEVVTCCFEALKKDCDRVYLTIKADYRKGPPGRIENKVNAVERRL